MKIKEENMNQLYDMGFSKSHVAVYPECLVRVADWDKKYILEIGISSPCINFWDGKDKNGYRVIDLWECHRLENTNTKILLEPDVKEHLYYERHITHNEEIKEYIQDLIENGFIEE